MPFYIWKLNGKVVAYKQSSTRCPPPAIEVTKEDFEALGFAPDVIGGGADSSDTSISPTMSALMNGIDSV